jgi:hypothetical protein
MLDTSLVVIIFSPGPLGRTLRLYVSLNKDRPDGHFIEAGCGGVAIIQLDFFAFSV